MILLAPSEKSIQATWLSEDHLRSFPCVCCIMPAIANILLLRKVSGKKWDCKTCNKLGHWVFELSSCLVKQGILYTICHENIHEDMRKVVISQRTHTKNAEQEKGSYLLQWTQPLWNFKPLSDYALAALNQLFYINMEVFQACLYSLLQWPCRQFIPHCLQGCMKSTVLSEFFFSPLKVWLPPGLGSLWLVRIICCTLPLPSDVMLH